MGGVPLFRVVVFLLAGLTCLGCVTRSAFDELQRQHDETVAARNALAGQVERLEIERDSFEGQYLDAQESFEDERLTRTALATDLAESEINATRLDRDLEAERLARLAAATALAKRESQLTSMQSTYDELVSDLESEVSSGQIEIERLRDGLRLNVSDDILFASGSAELDQIGRDVLVKVAGRLKELGDFIEVRGHTDDLRIRGGLAKRFPSNWELAAARAARVVRLLEQEGVPGDRLAAVSLGPNDPIAANDSPENRARNRRIEIRLEPRSDPDPKPES
jgi:chemotaxis protein MotB